MRTISTALFLGATVFAQPQQDLGARMQVIAQSLGVSCNYCHTADRGRLVEPLSLDDVRFRWRRKFERTNGAPCGEEIHREAAEQNSRRHEQQSGLRRDGGDVEQPDDAEEQPARRSEARAHARSAAVPAAAAR